MKPSEIVEEEVKPFRVRLDLNQLLTAYKATRRLLEAGAGFEPATGFVTLFRVYETHEDSRLLYPAIFCPPCLARDRTLLLFPTLVLQTNTPSSEVRSTLFKFWSVWSDLNRRSLASGASRGPDSLSHRW